MPSPSPVTIRRLGLPDVEAYVALRREMLADAPFAFLASPEDDIGCDVAAMGRSLQQGSAAAVLGGFAPALVGAVGVIPEAHRKAAHKATVWGMYVTPSHRRGGVGRRLLEAAIDYARSLPGVVQVHLGVSRRAPAARALYEALGFRCWGTEPRAVRHGRVFADEDHLVLRLDDGEGSAGR